MMKTLNSKYKLTLAATPIGNLSEVNQRFLDALQTTDILLCEDTRVIKKLLSLLGVNKHYEYIKFDLFSEHNNLEQIIELIHDGKNIMMLSDAGYPTISDPGYNLVSKCIAEGIAINVINGPCSIIHALVGSGFSSREFLFLGFLGKTKTERMNSLKKYSDIEITMVILESVHRLKQCLTDIYEVYGNQKICIARELTKLHEEFIYIDLASAIDTDLELKGEFVIVLEKKNSNVEWDQQLIINEIKQLINDGLKTKEISQYIANKYHLDNKEWYKKIIELKKEI